MPRHRAVAPPSPPGTRKRRRSRDGRVRSLLELLGLTALAIAQPMLDVFGRAPEWFIFQGADDRAIVGFAIVVAFGPGLALWATEQVIGCTGAAARRGFHQVCIAALSGVFALQVVARWIDPPVVIALAVVAVAGIGIGALRNRHAVLRDWLVVMGGAPAIFLALFLAASPVADLLRAEAVAATPAPVSRPRSIVFLQLDEWPLTSLLAPDGSIDADLFPNLAALAADGTWFRNTTTPSTQTVYAVPSILTGREPHGLAVPIASEYPENLFTLLGASLDLDVVETVTRLCPTALCSGPLIDRPDAAIDPEAATAADDPGSPSLAELLGDAFGVYPDIVVHDRDAAGAVDGFELTTATASTSTTTTQPSTDAAVQQARDDDTETDGPFGAVALPVLQPEVVTSLLASIERDEDPTLHYAHVLLPHVPYRFLPSGQAYDTYESSKARGDNLGGTPDRRSTDPAAVDLEHQKLVLQAVAADRVVGDIVDRLRATGLYDDTIIVVAADHGVGLIPGGPVRGLEADDLDAYADLLYVPMIVRAPGLARGTTDAPASVTDLVPTLAALLGIDLPWNVDGQSLVDETLTDRVVRRWFPGDTSGDEGVSFDGAAEFGRVLDRHLGRLLRDDNPEYRPYDITDAGELVGTAVGDHGAAPPSPLRARIDDLDAWRDVDPSAAIIPARLIGRIDGVAPEADFLVAVAIAGRIAAVVPTVAAGGGAQHLEAVLAPDLLVAGNNEIEIFVVGGREGARTLSAVPLVR